MALEELLARNNELLAEHNELIRKLLTLAPAAGAASGQSGESAPKRRGRQPADKSETKKAPTVEDAVKLVSEWLDVPVEVDEDEEPIDTDENMKNYRKRNNRKKFAKECLNKLGVTSVKELADEEDIAKFIKWITMKQEGKDPFAAPADET